MIIGLVSILLLVFFLPLLLKPVEKNLEMFLFIMGFLAAIISGVWNTSLFVKAAMDPIYISLTVLLAGLLFRWYQEPLEKSIRSLSRKMPYPIFIGSVTIVLGLVSSVITAIIAALVLVLIVTTLHLDRQSEIRFVILSCFSIGLGAALTPLGEPLSTIAISKLNEDFFFLVRLIGPEVFAALLIFGTLAALLVSPPKIGKRTMRVERSSETYEEILVRSLKIYFFIAGLTFLGAGFEPLINQYFLDLNSKFLYWINMISAVLDNATLTAAEVSPAMNHITIRSILIGLLMSGGMMIPGNIPNIIAANKLQISSKEWAMFGFPLGLVMMLVFFFAFLLTSR
ncbi:DUF1646 family protein [Ammoniphilus sp. CFH 90114]|uniref:DUF1646 family protein n=1 Tax=Ammoniphilus sp. CFH 90114 TaxID=2493665 RepID=UPI00100FBAEC|nr:DUF1646 family protein [Ammoniphilus sp. CFH 90114]RXT06515.1 DUF1646 domain-containing protein [Ammoniphilus sp. CFH 90114]